LLSIMFFQRHTMGGKMNLKRNALAALGVVALAVPAAALAKPGGGHGNGGGNGHGNGGNPKVGYVFKGSYGGAGLVSVDKGNGHVKKAGLVGQDVQFDLSSAKLRVADSNGDGQVTADDVAAGDRVQVKARLGRKDPGAQPFEARKLIDKSNPGEDGGEDG
jgi:hypothetical protein